MGQSVSHVLDDSFIMLWHLFFCSSSFSLVFFTLYPSSPERFMVVEQYIVWIISNWSSIPQQQGSCLSVKMSKNALLYKRSILVIVTAFLYVPGFLCIIVLYLPIDTKASVSDAKQMSDFSIAMILQTLLLSYIQTLAHSTCSLHICLCSLSPRFSWIQLIFTFWNSYTTLQTSVPK